MCQLIRWMANIHGSWIAIRKRQLVTMLLLNRMIVLFLFCFEFRQKGLPQGARKVAPKKFPMSDSIHLPKGGLRRVVGHSDSWFIFSLATIHGMTLWSCSEFLAMDSMMNFWEMRMHFFLDLANFSCSFAEMGVNVPRRWRSEQKEMCHPKKENWKREFHVDSKVFWVRPPRHETG